MGISWENFCGVKMEKAIYKITNKINGKIYIGQSINPEQRFEQHCRKKEKNASLINKAINKYGKSNFELSIIEWSEDYNEKEKYWIQYYQSLVPYGYNIARGGENPPILSGEKNPFAKISQETANNVIKQLLDWKIPRKTIVANNKITQDILRHINEGTTWRQEGLEYPLRPQEKELDNWRAEKIILGLITTKKTQKELAKEVGWGRTAATNINNGKTHKKDCFKYPLRENAQYNSLILQK